MSFEKIKSELGASGVDWDAALSQKLLRFPQNFEVSVIGSGFRVIIQNNTQ